MTARARARASKRAVAIKRSRRNKKKNNSASERANERSRDADAQSECHRIVVAAARRRRAPTFAAFCERRRLRVVVPPQSPSPCGLSASRSGTNAKKMSREKVRSILVRVACLIETFFVLLCKRRSCISSSACANGRASKRASERANEHLAVDTPFGAHQVQRPKN